MVPFDLSIVDTLPLDEARLLDVCERRPVFLVVLDEKTPVRLSESAYKLLRALQNGSSLDQIAAQVPSLSNIEAHDQLSTIIADLLTRLENIKRASDGRRLPWGFWWKWPLLSEQVVLMVARSLHNLYERWLLVLLSVISALLLSHSSFHGLFQVMPDSGSLFLAYLIFLLSLAVHECGHATAAHYFDVPPGEIGAALYLIYPAFYSDVTACWRLRRWQRAVVDLGGCYFQLLFGVLLLLLAAITHWPPLRPAFLMIFYSCLFSLNPIFKCDGYWLLSDSLGVADLAAEPRRFMQFLWSLLTGKSTSLPWPKHLIGMLTAYSVLSIVIWARFAWALIPVLANQARSVRHIATLLSSNGFRSVDSVILLKGGTLAYTSLLLFLIVGRWFKPIYDRIQERARAVWFA